MTSPTLPTAGLAELLVRVEADEDRMREAQRSAPTPWNEGYAYGSADAYGVVASQIRELIKANLSGAA
jgi:hypothetical protein